MTAKRGKFEVKSILPKAFRVFLQNFLPPSSARGGPDSRSAYRARPAV